MLAKVLMYNCYGARFQSERNKYVKKLTHFHCKCNKKHLLYVLFCKYHPYGPHVTPEMMEIGCTCADASAKDFCTHLKYLLNFRCHKYC